MRADLHVHSTASDGQYAPAVVVQMARARGLRVLALADHDTTAGLDEARAAAHDGAFADTPLIIPAIELSAEISWYDPDAGRDRAADVHMLGYGLDDHDAAFQAQLARFRADRLERGQRIVARCAELGMPIAWQRVLDIADGASIGRPHVARALVEAGYCPDVPTAFARYLYNGGPAYVARQRLSPEDAIALIHQAGGAAVMAHPGLTRGYMAEIERLVPLGLDGVEVQHPSSTEAVRSNLRALAGRYDLVQTGGSDFHGEAIKPGIRLGQVTPPEGAVEALLARAARYQTRSG